MPHPSSATLADLLARATELEQRIGTLQQTIDGLRLQFDTVLCQAAPEVELWCGSQEVN